MADTSPTPLDHSQLEPLPAPGRAALARGWNEQRLGLVALVVTGALLVLVLIALGERWSRRDEVLTGVEVGSVSLSHASERDALHRIKDLAVRLRHQPIHGHAGRQELTVDPAAIGYRVDAAATVRAARRDGRASNPLDALTGVGLRRLRPDHVALVVRYDATRLASVIDGWVGATGKGLVDGGLRFEGAQVAEVRPRRGVGINRVDAERRLLSALRAGSTDIGRLRIGPTSPTIDLAEVRRAARHARKLLAAPVTVTVTADTANVTLAPAQVASVLRTHIRGTRLLVRVDDAALQAVIGPALNAVQVSPRDATFAITGTQVSVVPAVPGRAVSLAVLGSEIARGRHSVTAQVVISQPARTTAWAEQQHITELVSTFTTNHPCCAPRVTNIHHAADAINGIIVEPGATFSLNDNLGPRTAEKGYVLAPGIGANLEFEDSIGGGVSQVSTTLYNATFFGCYQDVTHTVHALYISRYPMGREATLNYPSIDNKFRNDSHSGILIRAFYSDTSITVAFYGNKEGRSCRAEGPNVLQTIPVENEYVDDPTLPVGTEKEIAHGSVGYVVENFRIISRQGQPDVRERYVESYSMAKAKVARGVGAAPPPTVPPSVPPVTPVPPS